MIRTWSLIEKLLGTISHRFSITMERRVRLSSIRRNKNTNYGYALWTSGWWQEFVPGLDNLAQIDILVYRRGYPGDVEIKVTNSAGDTICEGAILEEDIPYHPSFGYSWVSLVLGNAVPLVPSEKYKNQCAGAAAFSKYR